ncbi:alpha/beta fold hydrolase [Streptomyces heilongjiangensis]|uniref:Alpha/beta fold hydrolase n=1 Tax=Streptomyces heilongjiangensis TaxID=945052 RepID=A0ABW1B0A2_9ACTN|nr:alpha/beta fold hydrolase [Streptomyces heilongjiangensis]MDC2945624.1 alpha/beta fold hydrolase [Streptomyces heilongjiangensis]
MSTFTPVSVPLPGGFANNTVLVGGDGTPVVFLHGLFGQSWEGFLEDLAAGHKVYAPASPGSAEPEDLVHLDHLWDLLLYYHDLFEQLGLEKFDIVGHSFGGMVAAEFAAVYPDRVRKLVLIDALGLWRDDAPVRDHVIVPGHELPGLLYHDLEHPAVAAIVAGMQDPTADIDATIAVFSTVASTSHFIWPIAERGLAKRLRRIKAETLVLWGAEDKLVPPVYAQDLAAGIAGAEVELVERAGHVPQLERREEVAARIAKFLA